MLPTSESASGLIPKSTMQEFQEEVRLMLQQLPGHVNPN
jgi:hypothetical protein